MPLYEYKCKKCGKKFEYLAKNSADTPKTCPKCRAKNPVKQLSTFSAGANDGGADFGSSCPTGTCPTGACSLG